MSAMTEMIVNPLGQEDAFMFCAKPTITANNGVKDPNEENFWKFILMGGTDRAQKFQQERGQAIVAHNKITSETGEEYAFQASIAGKTIIYTDSEEEYKAWLENNKSIPGLLQVVTNGGQDPDTDIFSMDRSV